MNIDKTLAERGTRYGVFKDHAVIAQGIKETMWATEGWSRMQPDQKQSLEVIADKIARILNGDPDYLDNWHDIIGYAKLVEDRLASDAPSVSAPAEQPWIPYQFGDAHPTGATRVTIECRDGSTLSLRADAITWRRLPGDPDAEVVSYQVVGDDK